MGNREWAYYQDGEKKTYLKDSQIYDEGSLNTIDNKTGYNLGAMTSCRISLSKT